MIHIVRAPGWEWPSLHKARWYGYRWCLLIGPLMVFLWPTESEP